jgi:hypothetical protein
VIHEHSLLAHSEEQASGKLGKRSAAIQRCLRGWVHGLTDRKIMEILGLPDRNCVAPRITEMVNQGILYEVGSTIDHVTGKTVRLVALREGQQRLF